MSQEEEDGGVDAQLFAGVRFSLVGFDPVSESQYRSEIVRHGGAEAGGLGADCTHVVVCDLLYDDPVCVTAREDGKRVVTEAWVDDSLDLGVIADADRVLYRPVRDLNGIPGAESLIICLTGYQKNDRESIMKRTDMMGAEFSKAMVGNKVTHLICYKFEGQKYDLAKRMNIKLINHQWLEDCLKAWEILPIDNYTKSGWELEIMEEQVKDSEDEVEDAGRGSSGSRGIVRSIPVTKIIMRTHVDPDVHTTIHAATVSTGNAEVAAGIHLDTPGLARKAEDICKWPPHIRADIQSTANTNGVMISADPYAHDSTHPPFNPRGDEGAPADQVTGREAKYGDKRTLDTSSSALCTPNTSGFTDFADCHVNQSIRIPVFPVDNINCNHGKCLDNANQFSVSTVLLQTPSGENLSEKKNHSSDMSGNVNKKDDLDAKVRQLNVEGSATLCKANLKLTGRAASKTNPISSYSRRRSRKSVSPEANLQSVHQAASPHSFERNTPNAECNISPSTKSNHDISELADAQSPKDEVIKHVDRSDSKLSQMKSRLASTSPIAPNGGTDSASGIANSPFSSRDIASEAAKVSDLGKSSTETQYIKFDRHLNSGPTVNITKNKSSGSFKNLTYRRTSLKLPRSSEGEKLPEHFGNEKNMEALVDAKELARHETATEKWCTTCFSIDSEVGQTSSTFSLQNGDTEMIDTPQVVNKIEVAAPNTEHDMVVSHTTKKPSAKKVSTSKLRKTGAKKSRNAGKEIYSVSVDSRSDAASNSKHHEVASHENAEAEPETDCTDPIAECTTFFPEEISGSSPRNAVTNRSLDANREMNDVLATSNVSANVLLQDAKILSSGASADACQNDSSEKLPSAIARNAIEIEKISLPADIMMPDAPTTDKTESCLSEVVPQSYPKKLSSSASTVNRETHTPSRLPNNRVRKTACKRKMSAVQKYRSDGEPSKNSSVSETNVITPKRAVENSTNADKVTVYQDLQNANEDGIKNAGEAFCKDSLEGRSKDLQNSNPRSSKRKRNADIVDCCTDNNKENIPVSNNLTPKLQNRNNCVSSGCITGVIKNGKGGLGDCGVREANDCGTLTVLESSWFILSGHRLLRKEYKSILKRLKARVFRDSHHWCFQATHFIAPELRRTEKFFAAAAAGRWILKSDYLTACNEVGKLVEEEPFEWHGNGLNNGDTISLDAARKWRHLRQRTGCGAFHGMRIIIYGECISPSLDTMKRVVRAGDGTILATAPPYTRFLKSGVSFAVVSAGTPSTDAWVQEFKSHKIPCISTDYLVEYVCKPGYPLNKHVLFNMHDLADESLQKVLKAREDEHRAGTGDATEGSDADPCCSACGSNDREGVVMLICGSQGNRVGCGVGMHIDCWNPHLEAAPDGEWLCPKCEENVKVKLPKKRKTKKGAKSGAAKRT